MLTPCLYYFFFFLVLDGSGLPWRLSHEGCSSERQTPVQQRSLLVVCLPWQSRSICSALSAYLCTIDFEQLKVKHVLNALLWMLSLNQKEGGDRFVSSVPSCTVPSLSLCYYLGQQWSEPPHFREVMWSSLGQLITNKTWSHVTGK